MNSQVCSSDAEMVLFAINVISVVFGLVSTVVVFANVEKKDDLIFSVLGVIYILFSGRVLSDRGKRWRLVFIVSWIVFFGTSVFAAIMDIC